MADNLGGATVHWLNGFRIVAVNSWASALQSSLESFFLLQYQLIGTIANPPSEGRALSLQFVRENHTETPTHLGSMPKTDATRQVPLPPW